MRDPMNDPSSDPTTPATATPMIPATAAVVTVRIPGPLRELAGGSAELSVGAATLADALDEILDRHPALRRHLRTEAGALREHVNVFRNEEDIRFLDGEATALEPGDDVTIVPSIAGG